MTVARATVQIVGIGNGVSPEFELPAGDGDDDRVASAASNQVMPFVTLFDGDDNKLGV